jgi:hypothetical protein
MFLLLQVLDFFGCGGRAGLLLLWDSEGGGGLQLQEDLSIRLMPEDFIQQKKKMPEDAVATDCPSHGQVAATMMCSSFFLCSCLVCIWLLATSKKNCRYFIAVLP